MPIPGLLLRQSRAAKLSGFSQNAAPVPDPMA
jgi:hypothetical protein